jgi:hypothetical protein
VSWKDEFDIEANIRRDVAWHKAGLPTDDAYIDWLIARGDLYTKAAMDKQRADYVKSRRMNEEVREQQIAAIQASIDDKTRALARVVKKVQELVTVRRKTVRMADLAKALELEWDTDG